MTTPRSSTAQPDPTPVAPRKRPRASAARTPAAKAAAAKKPVSKAAADERKVTEMLRQIQIDGEALSAQIERLRHRFL